MALDQVCLILPPEVQVTCIFVQNPMEVMSCASRVSCEGPRGVNFVSILPGEGGACQLPPLPVVVFLVVIDACLVGRC